MSAATTPTSTLSANPDGTLTLSQATMPVRKNIGGEWKSLDPTLKLEADGRIAPATAVGDLHLSAGGSGPFATLADGTHELQLTLPFALPTPTLSGPTATYRNVLPGVDLTVTANTQGGLSQTLVVADAKAAANPALKNIALATKTRGITLKADAAGNLIGTDAHKNVIVTAPTPTMWDSTPPAKTEATVIDPVRGARVNAETGSPVASSFREPGIGAKVKPLKVTVTKNKISLTPAAALLSDPNAKWPVYIDPAIGWGASKSGYAVVGSANPDRNYWKNSPSNTVDLQSGNDPDSSDVRRTLLSFPFNASLLKSAKIYKAALNVTETWSYSCNATPVDVYAPPTKDLTSANATWNYWENSLGTLNDQVNVAKGYSDDCKPGAVGFDISKAINTSISAGNTSQTFIIKADNEASQSGWKRWNSSNPTIEVTFDHTPDQPTGLHTSPITACSGDTIGDGDIKLYAKFSDPDTTGGSLTATFTVWKDSDKTVVKTGTLTGQANPSTTTSFIVPRLWMEQIAGVTTTPGSGTPTAFSWKATVAQNSLTSKDSGTCHYTFDPSRQHAPYVTPPADGASKIGTEATFKVNYLAPGQTLPTGQVAPTEYQYQINGGLVGTVAADPLGNATFKAKPTRYVNNVTVTSVSPGNNFGGTASETFTSGPAAVAVDGDLTGDGTPDLVTAGGVGDIPSGVWLASGTGTATSSVKTLAANLGIYGNGSTSTKASAFNGAQIITGAFSGNGLQDILYYYPADPDVPGSGGILAGNGDGSPINANVNSSQYTINSTALLDDNGGIPRILANAGASYHGAEPDNGFPDLIGISGTSEIGYQLAYYHSIGAPGVFQVPVALLPNAAPDDTSNWAAWDIASAQRVDGSTDLFLWNRATGALHRWSGLDFTTDGASSQLTYDDTTLANGTTSTFNKGVQATLRAADINHDGSTDLWSTTPTGAVTAWLTASSNTITAQTPQTLTTASHYWPLNDVGQEGAVVTTTEDIVGTLDGTGLTGANGNTGDLFDPDVAFNGKTGAITAGHAIKTDSDFSISVWANPATLGQTVISESGTNGALFKIYTASDGSWSFAMARSDAPAASVVWDEAKSPSGAASPGAWYHLTAIFNKSMSLISLYVNDKLVAVRAHTAIPDSTGTFQIGRVRVSSGDSGYSGYYQGQIAQVMTFGKVVIDVALTAYFLDFNDDHKTDVVGRYSDGTLRLYAGNGAGGIASTYTTIATSWDNMSEIFSPGDFNGDGKPD
ncbi:hypothetical protein ADL15_21945, partial [Actinoplanes awajinensis subsp. mycoplanecinus]